MDEQCRSWFAKWPHSKQAEAADGSRARHYSSGHPEDTDSWPWWRDNESARESCRERRWPRALNPTRSTLSLSQGVTLLILRRGIRISQTRLTRPPSGDTWSEVSSSSSPPWLAKSESIGWMTRGQPRVIESLLCEKGTDCLTAALLLNTLCPGIVSALNPRHTGFWLTLNLHFQSASKKYWKQEERKDFDFTARTSDAQQRLCVLLLSGIHKYSMAS